MMRRDETHASHVCGERVHLVDSIGGFQALVPTAQVELHKVVRRAWLVFGIFQIRAAHPIVLFLEITPQMVADETTGSGNQDPLHWKLPSGVHGIKLVLLHTAVTTLLAGR